MLLFTATAAEACDFIYPSTTSMIEAADDVFVGDVITAESDPADATFTLWTLQVVERWKGASETPLVARGENVSDCSAALVPDDRVLVFYDRAAGLSLIDVVPVWTDPSQDSFLHEAACELRRGDSATEWHLRDEVRCNGCSALPLVGGWPLVSIGLAIGLARRRRVGSTPLRYR